jgi:hypothetical protein
MGPHKHTPKCPAEEQGIPDLYWKVVSSLTAIVKLTPGLGNQLFEYAVGRSVALHHGTTLKLDRTHLLEDQYQLSHFSIQEHFATPSEITALTGEGKRGVNKLIFDFRQRNRPYFRRSHFVEPNYFDRAFGRHAIEHRLTYDSNILRTPKDVYLEGYFPTEKYFKPISDLIRREFKLRNRLGTRNQDIAKSIQQTESVSVHVRRSDYLYPINSFTLGNLTMAYYEKCVQMVDDRLKSPHFFIFSDDPEWVTRNFDLGHPTTIVSNKESRNYEDLALISSCKHNIVSNSTFSWWGAWLNQNPAKLVLAPDPWYASSIIKSSDIVPDDWIRVRGDLYEPAMGLRRYEEDATLEVLMYVYLCRPDLQKAFPEAGSGDFHRLIDWAARVAADETCKDSDQPILRQYNHQLEHLLRIHR